MAEPVDLDAVKIALDEVRPYLISDGGDVEIEHIDGGTVFVRLTGACDGCPSSRVTLVHGIERHLREAVPGVDAVVSVGG